MERETEDLLIEQAKGGDKSALGKILKHYKPALQSYVNRYKYVDVPGAAIRAKGMNLIVDSLPGYKPELSSFGTYTYQNLRQLNRFVAKHKNVLSIPEARQQKIKIFKNAIDELQSKLNREPTGQEISDELTWNLKEVERFQHELNRSVIGSGDILGEIAHVPLTTPESSGSVLRFAYDSLNTPEQKLIMEYTFGMYGKTQMGNNKDIADQLKLTERKVRLEKKKIGRILKQYGT